MKRRQKPPVMGEPEDLTAASVISKKEKKSLKSYEKGQAGKKVGVAVASLLALGIVSTAMYFTGKSDTRIVEVCAFKSGMTTGDTIEDGDIMARQILKTEYDAAKGINLVLHNGEIVKGDRYILYSQRADVVGNSLAYSVSAGENITPENTTTDTIDTNPWYSAIEDGQEIYTLPFSSTDVYVKYLLPGALVRMRVISQVPLSADSQARQDVANNEKKSTTSNSFREAILPKKDYPLPDNDTSRKESNISEVVFEGIRIMDAKNAQGESIFDIYYTLACMEGSDREKYIQANAATLKTRIVPASLVLVVDKDEASALAEYEQVQKTHYKYTIVKDTIEDELYEKFNSIGQRITRLDLNSGGATK